MNRFEEKKNQKKIKSDFFWIFFLILYVFYVTTIYLNNQSNTHACVWFLCNKFERKQCLDMWFYPLFVKLFFFYSNLQRVGVIFSIAVIFLQAKVISLGDIICRLPFYIQEDQIVCVNIFCFYFKKVKMIYWKVYKSFSKLKQKNWLRRARQLHVHLLYVTITDLCQLLLSWTNTCVS